MGCNMKLSKLVKNFGKQILCHSLSLSMIFPLGAYADNNRSSNTFGDIVGGMTGAIGVGSQLLNEYQNRKAAQAEMANIQSVLKPVQFSSGYFPGCQTLPAMMSSMYGLCESQPTTQAEGLAFRNIAEIAAKNRNHYTRYTKKGNKEFMNHGHSCMDEKIGEFQVKLNEQMQLLTEKIDQIYQANNNLERALKPQLDSIEELEGYLNGGKGIESNLTRKYSSLFRQIANDASCGSFLDHTTVENFAKKGLVNIEKEVNNIRTNGGKDDLVTNLTKNEGNIQASIRKYARDLKRSIKAGGLQSSMDGFSKDGLGININYPGLKNSPALATARQDLNIQFKEKMATFDRHYERLGLGGELRNAIFKEGDHNFNAKLKVWRNKKQNECLRKKISVKNTSEAFSQFASQIDHSVGNVRSRTNLDSLQKSILAHLEDDNLSIDQKFRRVRKTINQNNKGKVQIMSTDTFDESEKQEFWDPAAYLKKLVDLCKDDYKGIAVNGEDQSLLEIEEEAKTLYREYKKMEREYPRKIQKELTDRMIDCKQDGEPIPYSISSSSCNADKLSLSSPNFCLGQSVECAKTINSCSEKLDQSIQNITRTQQGVADTVNTTVQNFAQAQRNLLESIKQNMLAISKNPDLKKYFPDFKFEVPEGLVIRDPEKQFKVDGKDTSVAVFNTENLIEDFIKNADKIKERMEEQAKTSMAKLEEKKQEVLASYDEEVQRWVDLENKCTKGILAYNQMENEIVAKVEEQQIKDQEALGKFCKSFSYN